MRYSAFILFLFFTLTACNKEQKEAKKTPKPVVKKETPVKKFGFVLNDFKVVNDTIKSGDTFGKLLSNQGYSAADIHKITESIRDTFDLRDIRIGKPYVFLKDKKAPNGVKAFIYEPDNLSYYVVDLRDSIAKVNKTVKPITIKRRTIAAEIEGSLAETLGKAGASPAMVQELADIYAWSIDFFKIQKGDKFAVTVREKYIDGTVYAGVEQIEAAFFEYKGKKIYAFPFKQNPDAKRFDYFDEDGKVLKSMFLKAPLKFSHITSRFSPRRFHPVQMRWKAHNGTDYAAPTGTPIMSTANGTVIQAGYTSGNGNYVKVKHNGTYTTQYLHMSKILVRNGQHVSQGQTIGLVGSTGLATGPHVCYRFWKNGVQVDALKQSLPSSEPMAAKHLPEFKKQAEPLKKELDDIANKTFNP
ncbi:peptidase M23 [Flavobacterium akiainvivens]|uniref:Peptidase M23 n=1 Tax=Flavobacterium akiainvivens TaxID=1202724 RepID=A0A0M8MBU0_9FLAO|nr:peptidoglycan DD-metalloendopeptidase family protein [Flavobacterium akiainvivens]KOS06845.1 peptidase M23 [Flavobacterium akiainvivens]SFQ74970.1 Murein DD-endopeptidase MepM and murein hydrolase activator NlpD, contain LysM domain [Flavobacterium akiainvivens]